MPQEVSRQKIETIRLLDNEGNIRPLAEIERDAITFAVHNSRTAIAAARQLGIGRTTMYRKWSEYKL